MIQAVKALQSLRMEEATEGGGHSSPQTRYLSAEMKEAKFARGCADV
jgi:hypothetical protein